jgi:hypothetical protein
LNLLLLLLLVTISILGRRHIDPIVRAQRGGRGIGERLLC